MKVVNISKDQIVAIRDLSRTLSLSLWSLESSRDIEGFIQFLVCNFLPKTELIHDSVRDLFIQPKDNKWFKSFATKDVSYLEISCFVFILTTLKQIVVARKVSDIDFFYDLHSLSNNLFLTLNEKTKTPFNDASLDYFLKDAAGKTAKDLNDEG